MFKKKAHIKPFAPLRSSDRRKLAASVITDFDVLLPKLPPSEITAPPTAATTDEPAAIDDTASASKDEAAKAEETAATTLLRNALFPENTTSAKFTTTHGPNLSPLNGTIYMGTHTPSTISPHPHTNGIQRALWVKTDESFYPTCYTLHETPSLLPFVHTHTAVMSKLQSGADLMTPGLYGPPFSDSRARRGKLVAIADVKAPGVAMAVGIAEIDVCELKNVRGEKGKAVRVLHWVGDELWNLGGSGGGGGKVPEKVNFNVEVEGEEGEDSGGGDEAVEAGGSQKTQQVEGVTEKVAQLTVEDKEEEKVADMTTKEVDFAFRNALLFSLHDVLNDSSRNANPHTALPFPLASSYVLKELITPKLPSHHPSLIIGKTSWKKVQKMLKAIDKEGIIKIKERGGDVLVHAVNWDDAKIRDFKPYPLPKASKSSSSAGGGGSSGSGTAGSGGGGGSASSSSGGIDPVKVTELFKPTQKLTPIYDATSKSPRDFYTITDVKTTLTSYFTSDPEKSLIHPTNGRLITINPIIASVLFDDSNPQDAVMMTKGTAPRDFLIERFVKLHQSYYSITKTKSGENLTPKPKSGSPPKVTITLETRMGKKVVTKVKGLEVFGVDPTVFSEELRHLSASSTTVGELVGSKPSEQLKEVLAQGSQAANVEKLLEKYGVGKRLITVDDSKLKKKK